MKRLLKTAGIILGLIAPAMAGPVTPPAGNYIVNVGTNPNNPAINITSATIKGQVYLPSLTPSLCLTTDSTGKVITTVCGSSGGSGTGNINNSTNNQVPIFSVLGSSNVLTGVSTLQLFTSSAVANGSVVVISTGGGGNTITVGYGNGSTTSAGINVVNSSPTQSAYGFLGIISGVSTNTYGVNSQVSGNNNNYGGYFSATGGTTNNALYVAAGNENFQNLNGSQFIQTNASKNLVSYDLFNATPSYNGQATFTNVNPSTFTTLAVTSGLVLAGTGNFSFLNGDGITYQVVGSSTIPTQGHVAVWGASNTIVDGGTSGSSLLATNNSWTGTNTFTKTVTMSSNVFITNAGGNTLFSRSGTLTGTTAQVNIDGGTTLVGDKLFNVTSGGQADQIYFPDRQPAYFGRYGATLGALNEGFAGVINTISSASDGLQSVNFCDGTCSLFFNTRGNGQDVIFNMSNGGEQGRFSSKTGFTVTSSETIKGAGGLGVTYGITAGSVTVGGQSVCLANGSGCPASGGGGSSLQITQNGVQITSPTSSMNFAATQFSMGTVGSTATIALNLSSITAQGQNVILLTNTFQSGATFFVSSGTILSQVNLGNFGVASVDALNINGRGREVVSHNFGNGGTTDEYYNEGFYHGTSAEDAHTTYALTNSQGEYGWTWYSDQTTLGSNVELLNANVNTNTVNIKAPGGLVTTYGLSAGTATFGGAQPILSTSTLQTNTTFYTSSGTTVNFTAGTANVNGVINILNDDASASAIIDGVGTGGQQQIQITAANGIGINRAPSPGQDIIAGPATFTTLTPTSVNSLTLNNSGFGAIGGNTISKSQFLVQAGAGPNYTSDFKGISGNEIAISTNNEIVVNQSTGTVGQVLTSGGPGAPVSWTTVGAGGASLSSTNTWTAGQTFTSSMTIVSSNTSVNNVLVIGNSGSYGTNAPFGGAFETDCLNANSQGNCTQFYSHQGTQNQLDAVVSIVADNPNYMERPLYIQDSGTANTPVNFPRFDGYDYSGVTFEDSRLNNDSVNGIFQVSVHNDAMRFEPRASGQFVNALLIAASTNTAGGLVAINRDYGLPVSTLEVAGNLSVGASGEGVTGTPVNGIRVQGQGMFQSSVTFSSATYTQGIALIGGLQLSTIPFTPSAFSGSAGIIQLRADASNVGRMYFYNNSGSAQASIYDTSGSGLTLATDSNTPVILNPNGTQALSALGSGHVQLPKGIDVFGSSSTFSTTTTIRSPITDVYALYATTSTVGYNLAITTNGFISVAGSSPTLSGCGTGPVAVGNNTAFTITPGSTAGGCTATFNPPFKNTPTCVYSLQTGSLTNAPTVTESATAWTITDTSLTSKIDVHCFGQNE